MRTFEDRSRRAAVVTAPILIVGVALVAAALTAPAVAGDLETVRSRAQAVGDEVTTLERELMQLERRSEGLRERIERHSSALAGLENELRSRGEVLDRAREIMVSRAVETYKSSTLGELDIWLSATTLADLQDLSEVSSRLAIADARAAERLTAAHEEVQQAQDELDERKQVLLADLEEAERVQAGTEEALEDRRQALGELQSRLTELERQAKQAAERLAARQATTASDALLKVLSGSGPSRGVPDGFATTGVGFEGLASWYGPGFEGNPTANGDIFDPNLFTAASKELELGTWLLVEREGRGVVVYVNDRGPYVGDRVLDLSKAAADAIGLTGPGVAWVRAEVLLKL